MCTTLGMLTPEQALELRAAGLSAYNHNLDTSPEFYSKITSSRKYEVRKAQLDAWIKLGFAAMQGQCCNADCLTLLWWNLDSFRPHAEVGQVTHRTRTTFCVSAVRKLLIRAAP